MALSRKKAIARRLTQDWVAGYLPSGGFLHDGSVEMLALDGRTLQLAATDLKWVCYVRDFNSGEAANPERLLRKSFSGRPRTEGLLMRVSLTDGDVIEGLAANDLSLIAAEGLFLTPPDVRSNTQRIWLPRSAIAGLSVIAVVGVAKRKQHAVPATPPDQKSLF